MQSIDFEHVAEILSPRARVHAFLCDLEEIARLHPLIESIEELPPSEEMPSARRYRVVDKIPFGPFRLRTVYTAALDPVAGDEIHGYAWQTPRIRLHTVHQLTETERGTRIVERVSVDAPRILRNFVITKARDSHAETLAKLKALLEASGSA